MDRVYLQPTEPFPSERRRILYTTQYNFIFGAINYGVIVSNDVDALLMK